MTTMTTDDRRLSESILEQFKVEINALSATPHADKIKINVLTMIAEDFGSSMNITNNNNQSVNSTSNKNKSVRTQPSDLGKKFYSAIRELLLMDKSYTSSKYIYKLPLVYLIDSMLKNIIGDSQKAYNTMVAADAHIWIRKVSQDCTIEKDKMKLRRVLSTWRDMELFPVEKLDRMGQCFVDEDTKAAKLEREAALRNQVSERQKANAALNKNMQNLLEDMRRGMPDAADLTLDKLMEINPSLYETIKATAQEMIDQMNNTDDDSFNFFYPLSKETGWEQLCVNQNVNDEVQRGIDVMNRQVRVSVDALSANGLVDVSSDDTPLVDLLVASSTASKYITNMLKIFDDTSEYEVRAKRMKFLQRQESTSLQNVDITLFTTEGVKKKSLWPINSLYSEGLPYASSSDGRRFATQIQLSRHLDYIFQKSQEEKSGPQTEERGWYRSTDDWIGISVTENNGQGPTNNSSEIGSGDVSNRNVQEGNVSDLPKVLADENRPKCVICGNVFDMYYDDEDGEFMYRNAMEIDVELDDAAVDETENVLVHFTCHKRLGAPAILSSDQLLA